MKKGSLRKYEKKHDKKAFKKNGKLKVTVLKKQLADAKRNGDKVLQKKLQFAVNVRKKK